MKKTLNVNIGSIAFVIDEDAYHLLKRYLDDVASRVDTVEKNETMNDLEMRIADIFTQSLASPRQVVGVELVRHAIAIIGKAEEFGARRGAEPRRADIRKLRRSHNEQVIGGVCGGIAEYFGLDVGLVRVLMFLLIFFGGISLWVYIILWIVIPRGE